MFRTTAVSHPYGSTNPTALPTGRLLINDADEILYANRQARHFLGLLSEESLPKGQKFVPLLRQTFQLDSNSAWVGWPQRPLPTMPRYVLYTSSHADPALFKVEIIEQIQLDGKNILAVAMQLVESGWGTAVSHLTV